MGFESEAQKAISIVPHERLDGWTFLISSPSHATLCADRSLSLAFVWEQMFNVACCDNKEPTEVHCNFFVVQQRLGL